VNVFAVIDTRSSPVSQSGDAGNAIETFLRREDAERFLEEVRGDDPELAGYLRIEARERKTGIVSGRVGRRRGGLIGVALVVVVFALLAW